MLGRTGLLGLLLAGVLLTAAAVMQSYVNGWLLAGGLVLVLAAILLLVEWREVDVLADHLDEAERRVWETDQLLRTRGLPPRDG